MSDLLIEAATAPALPIYLLGESGLEEWLADQPAWRAHWVRAAGFKAERYRAVPLPDAQGQLAAAVVGMGSASSAEDLPIHFFAAMPERLPPGDWAIETALSPAQATRACSGWLLGQYSFDRYRGARAAGPARRLLLPRGADAFQAHRIAAADRLVRDLINTPASDLGPVALGAAVEALARQFGGEFCQIVGEDLLTQRLPAIHAVGRAGPEAPRLLDLRWGPRDAPRLTLVGKGVCFDTGGLDLKPSASMALMKKDMGGAATAIGLAHMIMDARLPVRLRLLVPAVENSISATSYRPGDVLHTRKGLTVEVGNTDAEGRLVLADALSLAGEESPELLIDLATLTGAARVALGPDLPAVFAVDEALALALERSGQAESDPSWRMPLWLPYDEDLNSKVADINNIAPNAMAGAIYGALFLRRFVAQPERWLHADLYAWNPRDRPGRPVGAEAQMMRALFALLVARFGNAVQPATL